MEVVYKRAKNNEEIKNWIEKNGGQPAIIDDPNVDLDKKGLRINWKGNKDESMLSQERETTKNISWDDFFTRMDDNELEFEYSEDEEVNPTWRYRFVNRYSSPEE